MRQRSGFGELVCVKFTIPPLPRQPRQIPGAWTLNNGILVTWTSKSGTRHQSLGNATASTTTNRQLLGSDDLEKTVGSVHLKV